MKTYCKRADPTNAAYIEPAVWAAFHHKWKRHDYAKVISDFSGLSFLEITTAAEKRNYELLTPAIKNIACYVAESVRMRKLILEPVHYEKRIDGPSGKLRDIGIEHPMHQIMEHVAVYCLKELYDAKIEPCQYASIKGCGPIKGARNIAGWVERDNQQKKYCEEHGYRYSPDTEYYVQGDVSKCYNSLSRENVMKEYRRDIGKNENLLWFIDELLKMHVRGLIIGSLLSQFSCNYILSNAVREVYGYAKERRGKRIRLVLHQCWYMDDFLLAGSDRRNLRKAYTQIAKYLKERFGLTLKPADVRRWSDAPPDIMGYVIHRDGMLTIRPRTFLRSRRAFTRADGDKVLSISQARRLVSMKGPFKCSDCKGATKHLKILEISARAQKLISDYEKGRLILCIPKASSIVTPLPLCP